jgi:hypothetical protein
MRLRTEIIQRLFDIVNILLMLVFAFFISVAWKTQNDSAFFWSFGVFSFLTSMFSLRIAINKKDD